MNQQNKNKENQKPVQFQYAIRGNYIQEISFKSVIPSDIMSFGSGDDKQQFNKNFNLSFRPIGPNLFEVILNIIYHTNNSEQQKIYSLEMKYGTVVECVANPEVIHYVMFVEVPKVIYPYARAAIMNFVTQAGHKAISLPMIDFLAMFEQNKNSIATTPPQQQIPSAVANTPSMPTAPNLNFDSKSNSVIKKPSNGGGVPGASSAI